MHKRFYGFYRPIETLLLSIRDLENLPLELPSRLKLPLLRRDLISLGIDPEAIERLPLCCKLPPLKSVSEALGCLYVLEGSTLGGKIITRHLKKILPVDENQGCRFFHSYGDNVGRMWTSFLEILERHCDRHADARVVIESACQTFASLDAWLSSKG
jgi:heme oxygenase